MSVSYAVEPEPLDTAGAIRFAADQAAIDETFVAVNGDVLTDGDVSALDLLSRSLRRIGDHLPEPGRRSFAIRRRTRPTRTAECSRSSRSHLPVKRPRT